MNIETLVDPAQTEFKDREKKRKFRPFFLLGQIKAELYKISWTDKQELLFFTKMVVISTFVSGLSVYLIDLIVKGALDLLGVCFRFMFG